MGWGRPLESMARTQSRGSSSAVRANGPSQRGRDAAPLETKSPSPRAQRISSLEPDEPGPQEARPGQRRPGRCASPASLFRFYADPVCRHDWVLPVDPDRDSDSCVQGFGPSAGSSGSATERTAFHREFALRGHSWSRRARRQLAIDSSLALHPRGSRRPSIRSARVAVRPESAAVRPGNDRRARVLERDRIALQTPKRPRRDDKMWHASASTREEIALLGPGAPDMPLFPAAPGSGGSGFTFDTGFGASCAPRTL